MVQELDCVTLKPTSVVFGNIEKQIIGMDVDKVLK